MRDRLEIKSIIYTSISIIMLLINLIISSFNLSEIIKSGASMGPVITKLAQIVIFSMVLTVIFQLVVLLLTLFNKEYRLSLSITSLVIEIIYFIIFHSNVAIFMFMNMTDLSKKFGIIVMLLFEYINIRIIILLINKIIRCCKRTS